MASAGWKTIVSIGSSPAVVGDLTSAELMINGDIYDITALGGQWKLKLGGLADYQVKLAGNFNMTDAQQASLQAAIITTPGATVTWQIQPLGATPTTKYSGTGIIKQEGLKFPVNNKEDVSWDIEGSGPLVFTP